jgi:putative Mn2+ efflux pump MntP
MLNIIFIAVALAMDSFSAAIACGTSIDKKRDRRFLTIPLSFSFFQAAAPLLGWKFGSIFEVFVESIDHWIAFILLSFIGTKMISETNKTSPKKKGSQLNVSRILTLSIATSIDAFVVGISFAFLSINISSAVITIGLVTYLLSTLGLTVGKNIKGVFRKKAGLIGGITLIILGVKILLEHTLF